MNTLEYENYRENKLHSDNDFPYNTYICSIPLDFNTVSIHWHEQMEIIYIKKGRGNVSLDFETHYVEAGDIIVVIPGQMHGISQMNGEVMEYENIIFSIDMLQSGLNDSLTNNFFQPLLKGNIHFNHIITKDDEFYGEYALYLDKADNICRTFPKGYKLMIKSCLFGFLYTIASHSEIISDTKNNKNLDKAKEIIKYIEQNYQNPISIEDISSATGFSASHFMRFFKKVTGTSFTNYLNDYRLSVAAGLLTSGDDNIIDIAAECGYDNLSYFNRLFKKKYMITPSSYRKKMVQP